MAFDAYFLTGVLEELRTQALGARVEKIHQPSRDTLILLLRCAAGRQRLLIAANPTAPRLHLTGANPENPDQPPMFCMLLRKHLSGGRLTKVEQPPMERLVWLTFQCTNEMGDSVDRILVAELMGRTTNVYLLDEGGGFWTACAGWDWMTRPSARPCRGCIIRSRSRWGSATPRGSPKQRRWRFWKPPGRTG